MHIYPTSLQGRPFLAQPTPVARKILRFAATKPAAFPITPVAGAKLSEPFTGQVSQALKLAMEKVDPALQGSLKEQGLKFTLAEHPTQGFRSLEDIVPQKDIPRLIRLHRNTLVKVLEAGSISSIQMKEALKDDQALAQELFQLLKDNLDRQTGVFFLEGQKAIRVSERVSGPIVSQDANTLSRLMRQETARAIDTLVGPVRTGKPYSEADPFQKKVLHDLQQAKTQGVLTKLGAKAKSGYEFKYFLPIDGVYNKEAQFKEAFATIMAAQHGGGALNLQEVEALCPSALQYCQKEVPLSLKSWPVRAWVRLWDTLTAIGSWFSGLFSRFGGKKTK